MEITKLRMCRCSWYSIRSAPTNSVQQYFHTDHSRIAGAYVLPAVSFDKIRTRKQNKKIRKQVQSTRIADSSTKYWCKYVNNNNKKSSRTSILLSCTSTLYSSSTAE